MNLNPEQIIKIHDRQIEKFGGEYGLREEGTFDMLANAPYQSIFGMDCYPSIFDKAAKYLEGFARHQVFFDGNKRTALDACMTLLWINDYKLVLDPMELYEYTLNIANDKEIPIEDISKFLEEHSISLINDLENLKIDDILRV